MKEEKVFTGFIDFKLFVDFFRKGSLLYLAFCIVLYLISVALRIFADYWIGTWVTDEFDMEDSTYIYVYISIAMAALVFIILRGLFFGHYISIVVFNVFKNFMRNLLTKSMEFFDTTPIG